MAKYYFIDEPETGLIDGYYVNKRPEVELRIWNERRPQFRHVIKMTDTSDYIPPGGSLVDEIREYRVF
jgi:hypothetical protein